MLNKYLPLKVFFVILFIILVSPSTNYSVSGLTRGLFFALIVAVLIAILQKWSLEYKNRNNAVKKMIVTENTSKVIPREKVKFLIWINIIFIIFSLINGRVATDLASLRGAARAQGEFVFFSIFPLYIILAIIVTIISSRYLDKQHMLRGWFAVVLLPFSAMIMENLGIFLLDSGFNYFFIVILIAVITIFIFFRLPFTQLIVSLKPKNVIQ